MKTILAIFENALNSWANSNPFVPKKQISLLEERAFENTLIQIPLESMHRRSVKLIELARNYSREDGMPMIRGLSLCKRAWKNRQQMHLEFISRNSENQREKIYFCIYSKIEEEKSGISQ